jgi:hypothetical protein
LTAVLKGSAAKGERAKATITTFLSMEELWEQRRWKRKLKDKANKRADYSIHTGEITSSNCGRSMKFPPGISSPHRSIEIESDHEENADDTTERQQHQAPSSHGGRPPPTVLTSQVNPIQLQRKLKVHWNITLSSVTPETVPKLSQNKWRILQPSTFTYRAITSNTSPSVPASQKRIKSVMTASSYLNSCRGHLRRDDELWFRCY